MIEILKTGRFIYGTELTVSCKEGHLLEGDKEVDCLATGKFSNTPKCLGKSKLLQQEKYEQKINQLNSKPGRKRCCLLTHGRHLSRKNKVNHIYITEYSKISQNLTTPVSISSNQATTHHFRPQQGHVPSPGSSDWKTGL